MKTPMMPREHMQSAPSVDALSDVELLAVVLGKGVRGCGVVELATRLAAALEDVWSNPEAAIDWRSMAEYVRRYNERNPSTPIVGLGEVRILEIAAAFALARRLQGRWKMSELRQLSMRSTPAAFTVFRNVMARHPEQENFFVLPIDSDFHPICEPIAVTRGGVASVSVHPREVFCEAIRWRAHAVIVAHNHPCGDATPSEKDIVLTENLLEAARVLHIPLLDHLVLANDTFTSIKNLGRISFALN